VAGGNIGDPMYIKKKSAILNFLFLALLLHNSLTSFVKFSFDFYLLFFYFSPALTTTLSSSSSSSSTTTKKKLLIGEKNGKIGKIIMTKGPRERV
jgi:hypothetical protein